MKFQYLRMAGVQDEGFYGFVHIIYFRILNGFIKYLAVGVTVSV